VRKHREHNNGHCGSQFSWTCKCSDLYLLGWGWGGFPVAGRHKCGRKAMFSAADCHALPDSKKKLFVQLIVHRIIWQYLSKMLQHNTVYLNLSTARNVSVGISPIIRRS